MTEKQIIKYLKALFEQCKSCYSYKTAIAQLNTLTISKVENLAKQDKRWETALDFCKMRCSSNAEIACLKFKIEEREMVKNLYDNNRFDEILACYKIDELEQLLGFEPDFAKEIIINE